MRGTKKAKPVNEGRLRNAMRALRLANFRRKQRAAFERRALGANAPAAPGPARNVTRSAAMVVEGKRQEAARKAALTRKLKKLKEIEEGQKLIAEEAMREGRLLRTAARKARTNANTRKQNAEDKAFLKAVKREEKRIAREEAAAAAAAQAAANAAERELEIAAAEEERRIEAEEVLRKARAAAGPQLSSAERRALSANRARKMNEAANMLSRVGIGSRFRNMNPLSYTRSFRSLRNRK